MKKAKPLLLALGIVLLIGAAGFGIRHVLQGHPSYGPVLLHYEADDHMLYEIQLERDEVCDILHFLELRPRWNGSSFYETVSECTYSLRPVAAYRSDNTLYSYSLREQDQTPGVYGDTYIPWDGQDLLSADGFHLTYRFSSAKQDHLGEPCWGGSLYTGVTTDPVIREDPQTLLVRRLDDSYYVYVRVCYQQADSQ